MLCPQCQVECRKFGKNRNGSQRYRCDDCAVTFTDASTQPEDRRRLSQDKAVMALRMLLEGASVRSAERLTEVHRDTIIGLMVETGENCARWMANKFVGLRVTDVECDEIWGFVGCKEKHRVSNELESEVIGDAYFFTAIERNTKLIFAWHLGKRVAFHAHEFMAKVNRATVGRFQLTTDAFIPYRRAVREEIQRPIDYATIQKVYQNEPGEFKRRYSPPKICFVTRRVSFGNPNPDRICTSIVERSNLSIRMSVRRMTRLTNGHSKKWANHEAMLALFIAYYNYVRVHSSIKMTPAMAHGLTIHPWTVEELLGKVAQLT